MLTFVLEGVCADLKTHGPFLGAMQRALPTACGVRRGDEGGVGAAPVMVIGDASVSHLVEAEDTIQDTEDVLYFRSSF